MIQDEVRAYLSSVNGVAASVGDDESLLIRGIIDSLTMVELLGHLERTYQLTVADEEMSPENFETINAIARFVAAKTGGSRE